MWIGPDFRGVSAADLAPPLAGFARETGECLSGLVATCRLAGGSALNAAESARFGGALEPKCAQLPGPFEVLGSVEEVIHGAAW